MILYVCVFVGKCENSSYTEPIFIKTRHRAHIVSHSHPRAHTQTLTRARAFSRPSSFAQITQAYITNNSEFIPFHFWFYYRCFRFGHGLWYIYIIRPGLFSPRVRWRTHHQNGKWRMSSHKFVRLILLYSFWFGWTNCEQDTKCVRQRQKVYQRAKTTKCTTKNECRWFNWTVRFVHMAKYLFAKYEKCLQEFPFTCENERRFTMSRLRADIYNLHHLPQVFQLMAYWTRKCGVCLSN